MVRGNDDTFLRRLMAGHQVLVLGIEVRVLAEKLTCHLRMVGSPLTGHLAAYEVRQG